MYTDYVCAVDRNLIKRSAKIQMWMGLRVGTANTAASIGIENKFKHLVCGCTIFTRPPFPFGGLKGGLGMRLHFELRNWKKFSSKRAKQQLYIISCVTHMRLCTGPYLLSILQVSRKPGGRLTLPWYSLWVNFKVKWSAIFIYLHYPNHPIKNMISTVLVTVVRHFSSLLKSQ